MKYPIFKPYGLHAVLVEWEQTISPEINKEVICFQNMIAAHFNNDIIELVPSYNSLAVYLKKSVSPETFKKRLKNLDVSASEISKNERHVVYIPVCYNSTFGIDIAEVAERNGLTIDEVVSLHTKPEYPVYFIGFLPGFPYLGGLDQRLHLDRKVQPRLKVAAGSVAIGGKQTGIYPSDSPGGWNIIGRTPLELFSVKNATGLLNAGDKVRFYEISEERFNEIKLKVKNGEYQVRREVVHD